MFCYDFELGNKTLHFCACVMNIWNEAQTKFAKKEKENRESKKKKNEERDRENAQKAKKKTEIDRHRQWKRDAQLVKIELRHEEKFMK